jgi:aminopeptidase N
MIGAMSLLISACQSPHDAKPNSMVASHHTISAMQAQLRASRISEVNYQLELDLTHPSEFSGRALINFNLNDTDQALTLDFNQANVTGFTINGNRVYPNYDGTRLSISTALLVSGKNQLSLQFRKSYSHSDQGLIQYTDPIDGNSYLYSHFLPSNAHMMVPQFDQPDLKAVYNLTVTAPNGWSVISASRPSAQTETGSVTRWQFFATDPISPHSFSLHAGPYKQWHSKLNDLPLAIYARQSIAERVDAEQWLEVTRQAVDFYQQQFGIAYPFNKYDQLLVPNLPHQAMANVAASTFDESLLKMPQHQSVMLRTLVEQWLGNLVTLKWWNDLWLSQSLATFMANKFIYDGLDSPTRYQNKYKIYQLDELRNSDPIQSPIATSQPLATGIPPDTINKGVALLNQLNFMLGEKRFSQGLTGFLTQNQFSNASLDEFMASLSASAKRPLDNWTRTWFYSAGVNRIEAKYQCNDNRISHFSLHQSATDMHPILREQKVKLGLFTIGREALHPNLSMVISYEGETTEIKRLQGVRCPDLVFPNYQDLGYVRVKLDPRSLETALMHLHKIEDPQLRLMLWQTLWDGVLEGEFPLNRFLGSVLINAPKELDPNVVKHLLNQLKQAKALLEQMRPNQQHYSQRALRALEQMSLRLTMTQTEGPLQSLWFDAYIDFATSYQAKQHLAALLAGTEKLATISLDQTRRWTIITHLNRYDHPSAQRLLINEKRHDNSKNGAIFAISAEVAQPKASQKRQWFNRVQQHHADSDKLMLDKLIHLMQQLYPSEQKALSQATAEQRLAQLAEVDKRNSAVFMQAYTQYLLPMNCSHAGVARLTRVLEEQPNLSQVTQKGLERAIQAEKQCLLVQERLRQ